jgi:hypothetical protein
MNLICLRCIPRWIAMLCAIAFALSGWAGWALFNRPPDNGGNGNHGGPPPPKYSFTLRFVGYDVQGHQLKGATLEGENGGKSVLLGQECEITRDVPTSQRLKFQYKGQEQSENVEWKWKDADEYKAWIHTELPKKLAEIDPNYSQSDWNEIMDNKLNIKGAKGNFPVIFRVK